MLQDISNRIDPWELSWDVRTRLYTECTSAQTQIHLMVYVLPVNTCLLINL